MARSRVGVLAWLLRHRWLVLAVYAALLPFAIWIAMRIPTQGAIEQLIVPGDPDLAATREFQKVFPERPVVLLVFEAKDPWAPETLARIERATAAVRRVPHVEAFSILDIVGRASPGAPVSTLRALALGTRFFRGQALIGDDFMTVVATFDARNPRERDAALAAIDAALAHADPGEVHRVGEPYITSWLERAAARTTVRSFALFGLLMLVVTVFLYRSWRALLAITLALGTSVVLGVAAGGLLGFTFTIVSALVPLTIMVTTLASLTYVHSRFVDQPEDVPLPEHHLAALRNKLLPITASTIAAASGFAGLVVSRIRPIREMGLWTAVGLLIAWCVVYSLFPVLQAVLRTPTSRHVRVRTALYDRISQRLPTFTYRHRHAILAVAFAFGTAGLIALVGLPGVTGPIQLQVDAMSAVDPSSRLYRDTSWLRDHAMGLEHAHLWIHLASPTATEPETLRAIDRLETALEAVPRVTGVSGPTTALRLRNSFAGHGEHLPDNDPARFAEAVGDVEELLLSQPQLRAFIAADTLTDLQIDVLFHDGNAGAYAEVTHNIEAAWESVAGSPALAGARMHVVGDAVLQAKIGAELVPTLAESFVLTAVLILVVFLVIFRSGKDRAIAMIPSVFALLVTFLGLRVLGGSLNVATILIATTVLGTTENDQLNFFFHMRERQTSSVEVQLRHAFRVSGRAVVFATLINAIGFLGLSTSGFPPLHQFGLMTCAAFVLALIGDFIVLPAALWIARRSAPC